MSQDLGRDVPDVEKLYARTLLGRTPKGAYSTRGRSGHLLETPFSEPLLRTLLSVKGCSIAPLSSVSIACGC